MSYQIEKSKIPVVIFCGGKGTRLKEETEVIPKPLVRIGGRPILWHIMKIYEAFGFRRFILPIGYKGEKIKEFFDSPENKPEGWEVIIADTGLETMTGARLKKIEGLIDQNIFMLTYGDGVAPVRLDDLLGYHVKAGKMMTITGVRPPARFGELILEGDKVSDFREKYQASVGYINGGFFTINKEIFNHLPDENNLSLENNVLPKIARMGQMTVFRHDSFWQCMDTIRDVELLNELWASGQPPWKIW